MARLRAARSWRWKSPRRCRMILSAESPRTKQSVDMQTTISNPEFQLSDPGIVHSEADADLMAYLQSYGLPYPPLVRYGNVLFNSRQPKHRVLLFGQAWLP